MVHKLCRDLTNCIVCVPYTTNFSILPPLNHFGRESIDRLDASHSLSVRINIVVVNYQDFVLYNMLYFVCTHMTCMHVYIYILRMKQYYNVSIHCNIYYRNTIQYSLRKYCHIAHYLYCNVSCGYKRCIFFYLLLNPYSQIKCLYQNTITYCNTLKRYTQYGSDPYSFTHNTKSP